MDSVTLKIDQENEPVTILVDNPSENVTLIIAEPGGAVDLSAVLYRLNSIEQKTNLITVTQTINLDTISVGVDGVSPIIISGAAGVELIENTGAGQLVYTIVATDNVAVASYAIDGADAALLTLTDNLVTLTADPDFETKSSYAFTVTATDAVGNVSSSHAVTFSVLEVQDTTSFITTWRTTTSNETITIQTTGSGYNYDISTSDGQTFTSITGSQAITFASSGDYDVFISGYFPRININNGIDKDKIIDVRQLGNIVWSSFASSFYGCSNLVGSFTDAPNLINVTDISNSFRNCSSLSANLSTWDVSNVTNFSSAFLIFGATAPSTPVSGLGSWDMSNATNISAMLRNQTNYNEDLSSWDVSNVTNMSNTFFGSTSFDQNLSAWDIANVTNFTNFAKSSTFSTSNYDAILIGWEATLQAAFPNGVGYTPTISINFGSSKYTGGGAAATARVSLISNFSWSITDGGIA